MISRGALAALISDLGAEGDDTLTNAFRDPGLVKDMVIDHHRVLQAMVEHHTVLPLRFGAMFASDGGVEAALEAHREALVEALDRVDGANEWGIKIFIDRAVLGGRLGEASPTICAARERIAAASEGRAFFLRRKLEQIAADGIECAIGTCLADSLQSLLATARAAATLNTQPRAIHGRADEMVWNGAYLVARGSEEGFFACIAGLKRANGPSGLAYECTGPWPPSSFAQCHSGMGDEP